MNIITYSCAEQSLCLLSEQNSTEHFGLHPSGISCVALDEPLNSSSSESQSVGASSDSVPSGSVGTVGGSTLGVGGWVAAAMGEKGS